MTVGVVHEQATPGLHVQVVVDLDVQTLDFEEADVLRFGVDSIAGLG